MKFKICFFTIVVCQIALSKVTLASFYPIEAEQVIEDVFNNSKEIESLRKVLLSQEELVESERKYYYPKLTLTTEYNHFYGDDTPVLEEDGNSTLSVTSEVYSNTADDSILAADNNRLAASYNLKDTENELYFNVMRSLINIERSRVFLKESDEIKKQMNDYILRLTRAVDAGISPRSYLRETQLIKVRFDNVISTVKSNIDNFFTQLSLTTGYKVIDKSSIGIDPTFLEGVLAENIGFNAEEVLKRNLGLLFQRHLVAGLKYSANSQFEKTKLTLFNETDLGLIDNNNNSSGNIRQTSAFGVRFEYTIFDIQKAKAKSSSYNTYLSELAILENDEEKISAQVQELYDTYDTAVTRRNSLLKQISLSKDLIETQEREILVDRIEFIDMVQSLSGLIQTYVELLDNDIQLYETIISYKSLASEYYQ